MFVSIIRSDQQDISAGDKSGQHVRVGTKIHAVIQFIVGEERGIQALG